MHLAVFGATGRTGRLVVTGALTAGHGVTAFLRDPDKLEPAVREHPALRTVQGDVRDAAAVSRAVEGADVVVSALAPVKGQPMVQTDGTRNIVRAMQTHGVRRIVSLTGAGVTAPGDPPRAFAGRAIRGIMTLVAGWVLADGQGHADVLYGSDLDWVVVRPPRLTDGPPTGAERHGLLQLGFSDSVSRADVAAFMLREATAPTYHRAAPNVTGPA